MKWTPGPGPVCHHCDIIVDIIVFWFCIPQGLSQVIQWSFGFIIFFKSHFSLTVGSVGVWHGDIDIPGGYPCLYIDRERNCNDLKVETENRVKSLVNDHKAKVREHLHTCSIIRSSSVWLCVTTEVPVFKNM